MANYLEPRIGHGVNRISQILLTPWIFKFRMGSVRIELYSIMAKGDIMDKEKYLSELHDALETKGKSYKYIVACCNYAAKLLDSNLPVIFDIKHLSLLLGIKPLDFGKFLYCIDDNHYHEIAIPKKNGGNRKLDIPSVDLKYVQRWILDNIISKMHVSEFANGFVKGKSILSNAQLHTNSECIINIDIKDFFPTINFENVFYIFKYYGYTKEMSYILAKLCTRRGILPQGSPASPGITNVLCLKLDKRLQKLAESYQAAYSRYADDITFSGNKGIVHILPIAVDIIQAEGFAVNSSKTRIAYKHQRQEVTGLIVNGNSVRVPQKYKRKLRQEIYYCEKFGIRSHQKKIRNTHSFYKEYLYGKAYFINMIEPDTGKHFLDLLDKLVWEY